MNKISLVALGVGVGVLLAAGFNLVLAGYKADENPGSDNFGPELWGTFAVGLLIVVVAAVFAAVSRGRSARSAGTATEPGVLAPNAHG